MYIPDHFREVDEAEIQDLLRRYPLATVVASTVDGLVANHLPLIWDGEQTLIGHVARANDLHSILQDGQSVLVVFQAQDGYVSPNWYPSKQDHHKQVPTWNYQVVHIHGAIHFFHDMKSKTACVGKLTAHFEHSLNGENAWRMRDAPRDFVNQLLDGIVAFRIDVTSIMAKSKLSQNKTGSDFSGVVDGLRATARQDIAEAMIRQRKGNS